MQPVRVCPGTAADLWATLCVLLLLLRHSCIHPGHFQHMVVAAWVIACLANSDLLPWDLHDVCEARLQSQLLELDPLPVLGFISSSSCLFCLCECQCEDVQSCGTAWSLCAHSAASTLAKRLTLLRSGFRCSPICHREVKQGYPRQWLWHCCGRHTAPDTGEQGAEH